jgi:DNA-binding MarR family transcriptional regulator
MLRFTGLGRSSPGNHCGKLEASGYVRTMVVISLLGRAQVVEITEKELEVFRTLLPRIRNLDD